MLLFLVVMACLSRISGMDPSIVTLRDVEHSIKGTVVQYSFHFIHNNVTKATVVPILMDRSCGWELSDNAGVVVEPIRIDPAGTLFGKAHVNLTMARDEIWLPPATGEPEGLLQFCYGVNVYRSTGTNQILVNAVRTKFTTRVSFVATFGTDSKGEDISNAADLISEAVGMTRASVCDKDPDGGTLTICVESSDSSQWRIYNVTHAFLHQQEARTEANVRSAEVYKSKAIIRSVDCNEVGQCRIHVTGLEDDNSAVFVIGGTAMIASANGGRGDAPLQKEEFAITVRPNSLPSDNDAYEIATDSSSEGRTKMLSGIEAVVTLLLAWGLA